jgi:transcriptional regulator with XRE-family HTH domain
MDEDEMDELDLFIVDQSLRSRGFAEAYEDAEHRSSVLRWLVAFRKKCGLSQVQTARFMGTTQSAVSQLEGGGTDFYLSTLQRYARAMDIRLTVTAQSRTEYIIWPETMQHFFRQPAVSQDRLSLSANSQTARCPMYKQLLDRAA